MEFPMGLRRTLSEDGKERDDALYQGRASRLTLCNEAVETLFVSPVDNNLNHDRENPSDDWKDVLEEVSLLLVGKVVSCIAVVPSSLLNESSIHAAIETLRTPLADDRLQDAASLMYLAELLRATKNLQRWFMQILCRSGLDPGHLRRLQSDDALTLYWALVQNMCDASDLPGTVDILAQRQQVARHACLSIFYATYSPWATTERLADAQTHIVETLNFFEGVVRILLQPTTDVSVLLSLMRLLHNLLASHKGAIKRLEAVKVHAEAGKVNASWATNLADVHDGGVTMKWVLVELLLRMVKSPSPKSPGLPGDRRSDLVNEILRVLYILRAGQDLADPDSSLSDAILLILQTSYPFEACQLAATALLMDAPVSYAKFLLQESKAGSLVAVMDKQVHLVVDHSIHGSSAASTLVPILSVLNRFAKENPCLREQVKTTVFPPASEDVYLPLASNEMARVGGSGFGAKNMKPLDAPRGTLRWKLIRLMTWPEPHTKRAAAELLWTLCDGQPREYVLRCGLGNALPVLGAKGLVEMPPNVMS